MATLAIATIKSKLQLRLRDVTGNKWTSPEVDEILYETIDADPVLSYEGIDTSLTASSSVYNYPLPAGIDNIKKIIITSGGVDHQIGKSRWIEEGGSIYFDDRPAVSGTMKLIGRKQYTVNDQIPNKYLNYILASAICRAYDMLMIKYRSGILMADVTQAEILTALNYWERKRAEEEQKLDNKVKVSY